MRAWSPYKNLYRTLLLPPQPCCWTSLSVSLFLASGGALTDILICRMGTESGAGNGNGRVLGEQKFNRRMNIGQEELGWSRSIDWVKEVVFGNRVKYRGQRYFLSRHRCMCIHMCVHIHVHACVWEVWVGVGTNRKILTQMWDMHVHTRNQVTKGMGMLIWQHEYCLSFHLLLQSYGANTFHLLIGSCRWGQNQFA